MSNSLDQLKAAGTTVVSDSGDFESIAKYQPQDATTNPSLILAAANKYPKLMETAIAYGKEKGGDIDSQVDHALDRLLVEFGKAILNTLEKKDGRVSTEVDAAFSYDTKATIGKAHHIIDLYKEQGVDPKRILIKIASTWEGIQAAKVLQSEGINCNLTLMFSLPQAIACAEAGAFLISPFVGRILDWYKAHEKKEYTKEEDPGVASVKQIFEYYKTSGHPTIVMGASFRNIGEITELAGCDYLTISPNLLEELINSTEAVPKKLDASKFASAEAKANYKNKYIKDGKTLSEDNEAQFRADFEKVQMAVDKLKEGIDKFAADAVKLKGIIKEKIEKPSA
ncbi:transaldolase [Pochonia chlamydosporia 170]|uniref:Transaldolase n=1 Tax=Pochonia chlamydosporia 170 TaxID=1380566 RepID=A0A179FN68_METCM|nr:transaldolase [Pochonia chlamydosporia 170]OAQ67095.1 transaldolase [Pochonia chlamydosporia 170]